MCQPGRANLRRRIGGAEIRELFHAEKNPRSPRHRYVLNWEKSTLAEDGINMVDLTGNAMPECKRGGG